MLEWNLNIVCSYNLLCALKSYREELGQIALSFQAGIFLKLTKHFQCLCLWAQSSSYPEEWDLKSVLHLTGKQGEGAAG